MSNSPFAYLFSSGASTPVLPPHLAKAITVDETRFTRARYRKYVGLPAAQEEEDEYCFVQLADPQFGMLQEIKSYQWLRSIRSIINFATCGMKDGRRLLPIPLIGPENDDLDYDGLLELEIDLARKTVQAINSMKPKPRFVVVCGDLVHAYPNKQRDLNAEQVKIFKQVFSQVDKDIPLVCTCGNHDIGDRPSPGSIQLWQKRFGDDYFTFWIGNDKYIVLNSQLYKDATLCKDEAQAQDRWLDEQLFGEDQDKRRHVTVFSHIPPFINSPEEPSGYFPLSKPVRLNLLERMHQSGVSHWFCGHYHRNAQGKYKSLQVVTTGAVGGNITTDPKGDELGLSGMGGIVGKPELSGLRVVKVTRTGIQHDFMNLTEILPADTWKEKNVLRMSTNGSSSVASSPLRTLMEEVVQSE